MSEGSHDGAAPFWVILGEPAYSEVRGVSVEGAIVLAVAWWPESPLGDGGPAGYYLEGGNQCGRPCELLEEAVGGGRRADRGGLGLHGRVCPQRMGRARN